MLLRKFVGALIWRESELGPGIVLRGFILVITVS